ncbi:uncharacterized protein LOC100215049 [Hydra vulgaris]|uniref:Uncharacterized protein LOC100215049 n=1 Tax=Hydra vulgaris TaxID=6087 RepID=A0ABM4BKJ0_HYDVU
MHNSSMDNSMIVWRKCTPFCDKSVECPEHHEILQAVVNCTDQLGHLSNLEVLKNNIEKNESMGWDKNSEIPDPVRENCLPLIHWAASLGKCNALEWMLNSGFDSKVTSSLPESLGENALHRCVIFLYKSRPKFTTKELRPKFRKVCSLLSNLLSIPEFLNSNTPLHTAATMLLNSDSRLVFFVTAIDVMAAQTREMSEEQRSAVLDSRNNEGNTCLHILAHIHEKGKIDYACQSIAALLRAGADKTMKNDNDQTPLDIAIQKGCNSIVDELVKIVYPSHTTSTSGDCHDPRSLMTMVEIPSRSRASPISSLSLQRPYYSSDISRSPTRSRSPLHGSPDSPGLHSHYNDRELPMVEPGLYKIKQEGDLKIDSADSSQNGHIYPMSPSSLSDSNFDVNSPLLNHLREAGLLSEVSNLLGRAKARDEGQLRRYQQQAKDLDTQIVYKLKEIDRINQEVETLRLKRNRCDEEEASLRKRLASCSSAIRELPREMISGHMKSSASPPISSNTL